MKAKNVEIFSISPSRIDPENLPILGEFFECLNENIIWLVVSNIFYFQWIYWIYNYLHLPLINDITKFSGWWFGTFYIFP